VGQMWFLLRITFWLGVVLVVLPSGGSQPTSEKAQVSAVDAVVAAKAAVSDMRQFCERQADACVASSQVAVALGHRAQAGAKMLYEFLTEQLGPAETGAVSRAKSSQQTLTPDDMAPAWRGPQPRRDPA
jgi:Family of unknown function (DUF5330)